MMLSRNTVNPIHRLRDEIDQLFSDVLPSFQTWDPFGMLPTRGFPAMNVWEDPQNIYVEAELPGLKMSDIEVLVSGDELTIKGERRDTTPESASVHRRERGMGSFARTIHLAVPIEHDKVAAELRDGVLSVTVPKAEAVRPRKIEVRMLEK
ncbi:MAG: Hsp20/alpha crystallin family protein [Phycisphaerae bacterium]|nr:Hsp20/alpha crystallin family protein [Phycisphaerae bacterium]